VVKGRALAKVRANLNERRSHVTVGDGVCRVDLRRVSVAVQRKYARRFSHDQMEFRRRVSKTSHIKTDEVSDCVLAFPTITTMLSYIKRPMTFKDKHIDKSRRTQLTALNALATLLVRDTGVVAVISKKPHIGHINLEVIACRVEEEPITAIQNRGIGLVTPKPGNQSDLMPTIVEPSQPNSIPLDLGGMQKSIEEGP